MKIKPSASAYKLDSRPHSDDPAEISRLYLLYRESFIAFAKKYFDCDSDTAADVYQDSFLVLYQNIADGRITQGSNSLKTYLFQIGKFQILNCHRKTKDLQRVALWEGICDAETTPTEERIRMNQITFDLVAAMEVPCQSVLSLYYWEQKSMAQIAQAMNYKNEQVAKNRKSLCMKKLKALLHCKLKEEGLTYYDNQ